jgi:hypothetical protein
MKELENFRKFLTEEENTELILDKFLEFLEKTSIINPVHIELTKSGYGEFPDTYKFTKSGLEKLKKDFKNII